MTIPCLCYPTVHIQQVIQTCLEPSYLIPENLWNILSPYPACTPLIYYGTITADQIYRTLQCQTPKQPGCPGWRAPLQRQQRQQSLISQPPTQVNAKIIQRKIAIFGSSSRNLSFLVCVGWLYIIPPPYRAGAYRLSCMLSNLSYIQSS